jgi:hypothetical protein
MKIPPPHVIVKRTTRSVRATRTGFPISLTFFLISRGSRFKSTLGLTNPLRGMPTEE